MTASLLAKARRGRRIALSTLTPNPVHERPLPLFHRRRQKEDPVFQEPALLLGPEFRIDMWEPMAA
ncbi:MAG: hypothetical protein AAGF74_14450 [Pseudomonadota bacterium]